MNTRVQLEATLDDLYDTGERFATIFRVHSFLLRRAGGQGIVQFVERARDEAQFAVKFFFSRKGYDTELAHFLNPKLQGLVAPLFISFDNADGSIATAAGYVFPPAIITERGEALNEWVSRVAPDLPGTLFVLLHVAEKLQQLHANGLCHRDMKPANILWLPSRNCWTLMDFGCTATIGSSAPMAFSLMYAAPETIAAAGRKERTVCVDAATDMWALGVIAFELLTRGRAFPRGPKAEARTADALLGRAPLPWEGPAAAEKLAALRVLKRSVLRCLDRDPSARPTSRELLGAWNGLFESVTGQTTAEYTLPEPEVDRAPVLRPPRHSQPQLDAALEAVPELQVQSQPESQENKQRNRTSRHAQEHR